MSMWGKSRDTSSISTARDCRTISSKANTITHYKAANAICVSNSLASFVSTFGLVHTCRF